MNFGKPPLVLLKNDLAPRHPLHDTSGDDHPLTLPMAVPRGVWTAPWFFQEGRAVMYAVNSRGILETFLEVTTVGQARDADEELTRLLNKVDRVTPSGLSVIAG